MWGNCALFERTWSFKYTWITYNTSSFQVWMEVRFDLRGPWKEMSTSSWPQVHPGGIMFIRAYFWNETVETYNLSYPTSSATTNNSFLGIGILFTQDPSHGGTDRGVPVVSQVRSSPKSVSSAYTIAPPASVKKRITLPSCMGGGVKYAYDGSQ